MARIVVIDELSRWGGELSKELAALNYSAEAFSGIDSFLHALNALGSSGAVAEVEVIVLALHGRGAAAVWYDLAVERIVGAFSRLHRNTPAFIFAADTIPDGSLVRLAADCQAALIQRGYPEQIPPVLQQVAALKSDRPLLSFYGEHSCTTHPLCCPGGDVLEIGIETADGDVAMPLSHAPRIYFDYMARNISITRPQTAMRIVQGMLDSPFHHEALDGRITLRSFITNFARICHAVNPSEDVLPADNPLGPVAVRRKYVGKETVYSVRCKYDPCERRSLNQRPS
jgi:hypothetical protein